MSKRIFLVLSLWLASGCTFQGGADRALPPADNAGIVDAPGDEPSISKSDAGFATQPVTQSAGGRLSAPAHNVTYKGAAN